MGFILLNKTNFFKHLQFLWHRQCFNLCFVLILIEYLICLRCVTLGDGGGSPNVLRYVIKEWWGENVQNNEKLCYVVVVQPINGNLFNIGERLLCVI